PGQGRIQRQQILARLRPGQAHAVELQPGTVPAVLETLFAAGAPRQDAAPRLRTGREKRAAAASVRGPFPHPPGPGGPRGQRPRRRLEGLPRLLVRQLLRRQLAELVVDQGQELLGGAGVALLDGTQDLRDLAHGREDNSPGEDLQKERGPAECPDEGTRAEGASALTSSLLPL